MKMSRLIPFDEYEKMKTAHSSPPEDIELLITPEKETEPLAVNADNSSVKSENKHLRMLSSAFPGKQENKARRLFLFIEAVPAIEIQDNGALKVNGEVLEHTHFVDFIKDAIYPVKGLTPSYYTSVYETLRNENVPISFISNPYRKDVLVSTHLSQKSSNNVTSALTKDDTNSSSIQRLGKLKSQRGNFEERALFRLRKKKIYQREKINSKQSWIVY